jgi:hypothetical protein
LRQARLVQGTSRAILRADHCNVRHYAQSSHSMVPSIIDGTLTVAGGVYVSLVAFSVIYPGNEKAKLAAVRAKWGGVLKVAGPLIIVFGIFNIVRAFLNNA